MYGLVILILLGLPLLIFVIPKQAKWVFTFFLQVTISAISGWAALSVLLFGAPFKDIPCFDFLGSTVSLSIDALSAFFILVINFTALMEGIYACGYLKPYSKTKQGLEWSLHFFSFLWLHLSMILICLIRDGLAFLIAWELMTLASFLLLLFDSEKKETIKIGLNYLVQMHIGLILIMSGFIFASLKSGAPLGFAALAAYFEKQDPFLLFLVFFIGFGIKAGFVPFHSWLPHAHPISPVSATMSGVMIKMGLYGILRVLTTVHTDLLPIGVFILVISLLSSLLGAMYAIVQHDLKRLLAYHSIENIGIIGIGIGIGLIGIAENIPVLASLGFSGGILHIFNHSLFKSLLLFAAGSVCQQTHTSEIEQMGGVVKQMPQTACLFFLGAVAICGLPPLNGFISEFLIFRGLFMSLNHSGLTMHLVILATISILALIGGLALFCFSKVFGIVFLGTPRSQKVYTAREVSKGMLFPQWLIALLLLLIGLGSPFFAELAGRVSILFVRDLVPPADYLSGLLKISGAGMAFILLAIFLLFLRQIQQKKIVVRYGPTWGCGYTASNPAVHQYTSTSFADQYQNLAKPLLQIHRHYTAFSEKELFPSQKKFSTHTTDLFEDVLIARPLFKLNRWMERAAVFQTGQLQHYVLYALLFMALIFGLTFFKLI